MNSAEKLRKMMADSPQRRQQVAQALDALGVTRAVRERQQARQLLAQTDDKIQEYQDKLEAFETFVRQAAEVSSAVPELMQRLEDSEAENAELR